MTYSASLIRAAHNILVRSFGLHRDQNLLIFADPTVIEVADIVTRVARSLKINSAVFLVTPFMQSELGVSENLPLPVEAAIRQADAILSCLSDRPEHLQYRLRVLKTGWSRHTRLAHAPGMNLNILAMADTDFGFISECSQVLATTLLLGKQMELITQDHCGQEYQLTLEIGGWNCPPGISDGIIPKGAWANLPPGEVYTVPQGGKGEIVINGSMPGRVLWPEEELILTIESGRLVSWYPTESLAARHLYETQIAYAQQQGDQNWSNIAEIGFGLNPAIKHLIGIELVDEKMAGTVHIALGLSTALGGTVDSVIHADLVVMHPTVKVDGHPLLEKGEWCVNNTDWYLDYRTVHIPCGWWEEIRSIRRSGIRAIYDHDRLLCQWNSGRGRTDSTTVGAESTARQAGKAYELLPEDGSPITKSQLLEKSVKNGIAPPHLPGLLWILRQYDLVRLAEGGA